MKLLNQGDRAKVVTMTSNQVRAMAERGERLPDGLSVGGGLYLNGCAGLTSLPDGLSVGGWLDLEGCTVEKSRVIIAQQVPETVIVSIVGRRLGVVLQHRLIVNPAFYDAVITHAGTDEDGDLFIECDRNLLAVVAMPKLRKAA